MRQSSAYLDFEHAAELFGGEKFVAETAVERLACPVLPGRGRVDERRVDAGEATPVAHRVGGHLGTVVHPDMRRGASRGGDDVIKHRAQLVGGAGAERAGGQRFTGVLVDDVEEPHLATVDSEIGLKVQRPHVIRTLRPHPLVTSLTEAAFLTSPRRPLQSFVPPESVGAFTVGDESFVSGDGVGFAPPPPRMLRGDLAQPSAEHPLDLDHRDGWAPLRAAGLAHHPTRPSLGTPEPLTEHLHGAASTVRAHQFPRFSSLSMSMSKA